jgi:hypothetical protein
LFSEVFYEETKRSQALSKKLGSYDCPERRDGLPVGQWRKLPWCNLPTFQ